ncbi:hypothetical protein G6F37_012854 [Rhizopus arrhizus]|nr:hypothetical protein G6F38_012538 [Rhizopus arrhizus]KAG1141184.1 hypothetical protein G6F37_012854 [Rhizopus arrhizus]
MYSANTQLLTKLLTQLLTESRLGNATICAKYDPTTSFNSWLVHYELQCKRLGLSDEQKLMYVGEHLPNDVAAWLVRSSRTTSWEAAKVELLKTFGIPDEKHKLMVRKRLESLRQGNMPSRRFALLFESVALDFPAGHCVDSATLRIIFLKVMAPRRRNAVLPNITSYSTWTAISNAAIAIEESVSLDDNILEEAFSRLSLHSPATAPVTASQPSNSASPSHYRGPEAFTSRFGSSPTPV